ncbi:MAG: hypothetical protein Q9220_000205 [cf. Caloplaca sp. 1 TL-2023]
MKLTPTSISLATVFHLPIRLPSIPLTRLFHTTPSNLARPQRPKTDRRITLIRYHLHHPATPRPLRFSRLRALRHWTIHRAAQLHLHKTRQAEERELERQYNSMRAACEELRTGAGDGGRLYRQAMSRKGLLGEGGVPIEYARGQVEGPGRSGWDAGWRRE